MRLTALLLATAAILPAQATRQVSLTQLLPNTLEDQKQIWTFPAKLNHKRNWIPTAVILAAAAGFVALDPVEGRYFHQTTNFSTFNNAFSSNATVAGILATPVALYGTGLLRKDSKMQQTALFAGEALANAEILSTVLKDATKRARPSTIQRTGNYSDTWFESKGSVLSANGGFPSGHTIAAFSVATIVAHRYGNHKWVPYAAYGLATAVGFSRLSLSAHFTSDVFIGAALGYSISRFAVLRQ